MIQPSDIRVNRQRMGYYDREHVAEGGEMVFSWALDTDRPEVGQTAYRVIVSNEQLNDLFDSEWVESTKQECSLTEMDWPRGECLTARVFVRDGLGREGSMGEYFYLGDVQWNAEWITANEDVGEAAVYLRKEFFIAKPVRSAVVYACGLGYQEVSINGAGLDDTLLDPPTTDYTRLCQYAV